MLDMQLFWSYVEHWLMRTHFSAAALAHECGMSRTTLWRKRAGGLTVEQLNCIAQGIDLPLSYILRGSDDYGKPHFFTIPLPGMDYLK